MFRNKSNPLLLCAPWGAPSNIRTLISTSVNDFNLGLHATSKANQVIINRQIINQYTPQPPTWLNQVHGKEIIDLDNLHNLHFSDNLIPIADASFSRATNKVCAIMTADCLPILISDIDGSFVMAIHGGWRGIYDGIIESALNKINDQNQHKYIAFIGPAICKTCFEVGSEVYEKFIALDKNLQIYFKHHALDKFLANLRAIAKYKLISYGIPAKNISSNEICTKCNPDWFFSYRANNACGRFATMIWKT